MDKRTVHSAHERIDGLEKEVVAIKTGVSECLKIAGT